MYSPINFAFTPSLSGNKINKGDLSNKVLSRLSIYSFNKKIKKINLIVLPQNGLPAANDTDTAFELVWIALNYEMFVLNTIQFIYNVFSRMSIS